MASSYLSVSDVLRRLKIARTTLYNWEKAGVIPKPKRNRLGYRVYDEEDIKKLETYAFKIHYPGEQPELFERGKDK